MTWTLIWTRPALRDMKKFERRLARRIRDGVVGLAETGIGIQRIHIQPLRQFEKLYQVDVMV